MNAIEFYFDFSSPYGYLASTRIDALGERYGRSVDWYPYLVGTAMKITGHQPMVSTPMFQDYVLIDVPRFARLLDVPLVLSEFFPLAASAASRAYYWLAERDPGVAKRFATRTYYAMFGEGRDISNPDELRAIASDCGTDGDELLQAVQDPRTKDLFRKKNDAALAKGVLGSPFVLVDGEPFWGADRLYQVEKWLESGGW